MQKMIVAALAAGLVSVASAGSVMAQDESYAGKVAVYLPSSNGEPAAGTLKYGRPLVIRDGSCGPNRVRVIIGGNNRRGIERLELGCLLLANGDDEPPLKKK